MNNPAASASIAIPSSNSNSAWARRARNRVLAREQLRAAADVFERLDARPWNSRDQLARILASSPPSGDA
ncbi:MAG TPA: hypothetical protein VHY58_06275 [Streptosporangiaceae bacterium]|nr:hypothetical protein [Streptosporangiaceae bacterium]